MDKAGVLKEKHPAFPEEEHNGETDIITSR